MNCSQIKEQLVDFLYGELSTSEAAAFSEHLRGCPGCRAEIASHETSLGHARAALAGPLAEDPPARVHAAILAAAKAAATRSARPTPAKEELGFFARLWRTPWLLPAFGAASVATAVFLVRVLKNPEVIPGQQRRSLDERAIGAAAPAPQPVAAAEAVAQPPQAPAAAAAREEKAESAGALAGLKPAGHAAKRAVASAGGKVAAPAAADLPRRKAADLDFIAGGGKGSGTAGASAAGRFAEPPPPPSSRLRAESDDLLKSFGADAKAAPAAAPAKPAAKKAKAVEFEGPGNPTLADEGEARSAGRGGRVAEEAAPKRRDFAAPPPAASPAPAAAPARADEAKQAAPAAAVASQSAAGPEFDEPMARVVGRSNEKEQAKDKAGPSLEETVRRADRLYANQDWTGAAAAYRDLLRRFPDHKDAGKWRGRLDQSLIAEAEARKANEAKATKAAKAKSSDVLMKEMK